MNHLSAVRLETGKKNWTPASPTPIILHMLITDENEEMWAVLLLKADRYYCLPVKNINNNINF